MTQVAQVAYRQFVDFEQIGGVFAPLSAMLTVMVSLQAQCHDAANFVFAGASNYFRFAADSLNVGMTRVWMTNRDDIGGEFAQGVAQTGRKRVGDNGRLFALETEAGIAEPCDFHDSKFITGTRGASICGPDMAGKEARMFVIIDIKNS